MTKKLNQCQNGDRVVVKSLSMNDEKSKRLMDMGLLPGTFLEVIKISPFGSLLIIKLRGFKLSFRIMEAENILVEII
ncbi:MAG: ferrous iron transport protein A [Vulcanibacillus sp.]